MRTVFNGMAPFWENNIKDYDIRKQIANMAGMKKDSVIADIGCGKGVMFEHILWNKPSELIAVDISDLMIHGAKKIFNDKKIKYINDDVLKAALPLLDTAIIYNAYPHLINKAALAGKFSEHIRRGGSLIIAHGCSKEKINAVHGNHGRSRISIPLKPATTEASNFIKYFTPVKIIDNDEMFFIKLIRK